MIKYTRMFCLGFIDTSTYNKSDDNVERIYPYNTLRKLATLRSLWKNVVVGHIN